MRLKRIALKNFKSYIGVTVIEDLSTNHIAFVGENGAGKSNIFEALEFILARDKKPRLNELLSLTSHRKTDGYVEVVFTNCDVLFQGDLCIRKLYSPRKCGRICFLVNGQKVNEKYVTNLLEICRYRFYQPFVYSRPMVLDFINASPKMKLDFILKNLGATFYETYSFFRKMNTTLEEHKKLFDKLQSICKIETDVTKDKYLKDKRKLMSSKLCIMYNISNKSIHQWKNKKLELEALLQTSQFTEIENINISLNEMKKQMREISDFIQVQENILEDLLKEEIDLVCKNEKLSLKLSTLNAELQFLKRNKPSVGNNYSENISTISEKTVQIKHSLGRLKMKYNELKTSLMSKERERLYLLDKTEKQESLMDQSYRLQWLQDKKRSVKEQKQFYQEEILKLNTTNMKLKDDKKSLLEKLDNLKKLKNSVNSIPETIQEEKKKLIELQNNISNLRRQGNSLENELEFISKNIQEIGLKLRKKVGDSIIKGCEYVLDIIHTWKSSGEPMLGRYYGLVIDNCKWPNGLNTAIETAIGNRLFSHIISDHKFGTQILHIMKKNSLPGEVTFIPVNGIITPNFNYPTVENAEPLLNKLEYSSDLESVMKYLFHGIMLCPDLETASKVARIGGVTCVTIQGDKVSRRHDFFGGYFDLSKSSILMFRELNRLQNESASKSRELEDTKSEICEKEVQLVQTMSHIHKNKICLQNNSTEAQIKSLNNEINLIEKELLTNYEKIIKNSCFLNELETFDILINQDEEKIIDFDPSNFNDQLQILNQEITHTKKELNEISLQIFKLDQEKQKLEDNMNLLTNQQNYNISESSEILEKNKKIHDFNTKSSIILYKLDQVRKRINEIQQGLNEARDSLIKIMESRNKLKDFKLKTKTSAIYYKSKQQIQKEIEYCCNKILQNYSLLEDIQKQNKIDVYLAEHFSKFSLNLLQIKYKKIKKSLGKLNEAFLNQSHEFIETVTEEFGKHNNLFSKKKLIFLQFVEWVQKFTEINLRAISENYSHFFNTISSGVESYLFADDDDSIDRVHPDITGILISFNLPGCLEQKLEDISYGQKIFIILALAFSFAGIKSIPFFVLDEIISGLSKNEQKMVYDIIKSFGESIQIFSSEHSFDAVQNIEFLYRVKHEHTGSKIMQITRP